MCVCRARGAALLLNIISAPLCERGGAASDLPETACIVDLQRLRDSRLIGPDETTLDAIDCVPDALRSHSSDRLASTILDDEADDGSFADDPELSLEPAGVCVTEADVERVLHECKRDPFCERVYSIDDITLWRHAAFPGQRAVASCPSTKLWLCDGYWRPRRRPLAPASFYQQIRRPRSE
jgi:hypothetical protein